MKTYSVTFQTKKLDIFNVIIDAPNVRYAKYLAERQLALHPEYSFVNLFTKNGIHSRTRKTCWLFYSDKKDIK